MLFKRTKADGSSTIHLRLVDFPGLADFAHQVKARGHNVMSFTGFILEKLRSEYAPAGTQDLLAQLDILIDGAYIQSLAINSPNSLSSSNQRVHVFNPN